MDKQQLEAMLIDYIDGTLGGADRVIIEREIATNKDAKDLYDQLKLVIDTIDNSASLAPSSRLKNSFETALAAEVKKQQQGKTIFFQPVFYRAAAAVVLVLIGVGIGNWINENNVREQQLAELRQEIESNKRLMLAMIENNQSASQRIQGVNVAMKIERADNEVVDALAKRMNEDPNTNVRLAALEALSKFHEEPHVRKVLIKSLAEQKDPVVQIALIQLMVRMKEKGAVKNMERIIEESGTINAVKDEAYSGILKLS